MIKISAYQPIQTGSTKRKKKSDSVGDGGFAGLIGDSNEAEDVTTAPVQQNQPVGDINPLLSLQEISDEDLHRKQATKHGFLTLDTLEDLRIAILSGGIASHTLEQIEQQVRVQRQQTQDPQLEAILDEIELRAAVELAKYDAAR